MLLATEIEKNIAFDLRASWQARVLMASGGQLGAVVLSVLSHTYAEAMAVLLPIVFPGFIEPATPCLVSIGKTDYTGAIVADVMDNLGITHKDKVIYPNEMAMRDDFRRLADRIKLNDTDRDELFKCVQRWLAADRRLDPAFDPRDPDAKRLVKQ